MYLIVNYFKEKSICLYFFAKGFSSVNDKHCLTEVLGKNRQQRSAKTLMSQYGCLFCNEYAPSHWPGSDSS